MKKTLSFLVLMLLAAGLHMSQAAFAAVLTVHSGAALTLNGSTLDLNCLDVTIEDGGTLDLATGTMEECGSLTVLGDGQLIGNVTSIHYCDSDNDGLPDYIELITCTLELDGDSDEDGIPDGVEDANHNGVVDGGETDPCNIDSDGDGIQDGTELGYTLDDIGPYTDTAVFQPDLDPSTTTDPLDSDTDEDGTSDGDEDKNHNGKVDAGETDPNIRDQGGFYLIPNKKGGAATIYLK